ncbi:DUF6465 family protein [Frisingicoccus sp.]|uniref:DUF6465 family protein n=1 Tax=Frisingicoccus sp. TaxID=1918627 RepID=UPI00399BD20F
MKTSLFVEYQGLQVNEKDIVAKIKEIWLNDGNKIKDIKDLKLYVKLDIENPIIRINTAFKGCSSLEKISVLPRIYHN